MKKPKQHKYLKQTKMQSFHCVQKVRMTPALRKEKKERKCQTLESQNSHEIIQLDKERDKLLLLPQLRWRHRASKRRNL